MTTTADVIDQPQSAVQGIAWRRAAIFFLITLVAIVLFAVSFAVGYARLHDDRALPGVSVAGVAVAGLDRESAEAKLRDELPDLGRGALTLRIGDAEQQVTYAEIERDHDIDLMLDRAFGVGRSGTPSDQLQEQMRTLLNGLSVPPVVTWDARLLAQRVAAIATGAESRPVDATISRIGSEYVVTPSVDGQSVDEEAAVTQAMVALNNVSPADTEIDVEPQPIAPAISTARAEAAANEANAIMSSPLSMSAIGSTTRIDADTIAGWVHLDEIGAGEWQVVVEQAPIEQLVDQIKANVDVPATNASYTFEDADPVVIPEAGGQEVDREAAISAVVGALQSRSEGAQTSSLSLAVSPLAPEFTAAQAQALVSRIKRLSRWTTEYDPSSRNGFGHNIRRPTNLIDGTVVAPGEVFDFVAIAGPITAENGYTSGAAIIHGNTQLDGVLGGGLCSASTTMFNAALRAGFEMGARRNHAYYISRYPVGLDATIWINGNYVQTMSFTNDSEYPILIRGINRPGSVTYAIYGVPDGREVHLSRPRVSDEKRAWTRLEYTDELEPGQRRRVEFPFDGFKSSVTRRVTTASGALLHEDVYQSSYRRVIGHVLVGWQPGDPPPGTIVQNPPPQT